MDALRVSMKEQPGEPVAGQTKPGPGEGNSRPEDASGSGDISDRTTIAYAFAPISDDNPRIEYSGPLDDASGSLEASTTALPGARTQYFGEYELLAEIARGGMGVVYKARQVNLNRVVALKMILAGRLANEGSVRRFLAEAEAAARLDHPGIVPIYEIGEREGQHFFSMGLVEGESLSKKLAAGPVPPREAAELIRQIATAVHYAHEHGIIHRDLKPANVLLDRHGQPRITDFGLAKQMQQDSGLTGTGQVLGTPGYMPPEQAAGRINEIGPQTDVYALGALLYCLLTGRPPFHAASPAETLVQVLEQEPAPPRRLNPNIPLDLETISLKCLEREASHRYTTAQDVAAELQRFLNGDPIVARPIGAPARAWRWCRRNPIVTALATAVAVVLLLGTVVSSFFAVRASRHATDATEKLQASYLDRARAGRWSGQAGRRFRSLEALSKAAAIHPSLELRDEAIACLALVDIQPERQWEGRPAGTTIAAFDSQLARYARSDETGAISIRSVATDQELQRLPPCPAGPAWVLQFSPDGRYLAAKHHPAGNEATSQVQVWNLEHSETVLRPKETMHHSACDFAPDGRSFAVGTADGTIVLFDLSTAEVIGRIAGTPSPHSLRFHPTKSWLAISSLPSAVVEVRDLAGGAIQFSFPHPAGVRGIAWRRDGKFLATACGNFHVYVWNADPPVTREPFAVLQGHQAEVTGVVFDAAGNILVSTGWDGTTRLWDPTNRRELVSALGIAYMQIPAGEQRLAFSTAATGVGLWELAAGIELRRFEENHSDGKGPGGLGFSSDDRWLASACGDGVRLWDLAANRAIAFAPAPSSWSARFSSDNRSLVVSGAGGLQRLPIETADANSDTVRLGTPQRLAATGPIERVSIDSAQRRAVFCRSGQTFLVDCEPAAEVRILPLRGQVTDCAISPDGRLAVATHARGASVHAANSGEALRELSIPGAQFVTFSPDGSWLAVGTSDTCQFWKTADWQPAHRIAREGGAPGPLVFTADGKLAGMPVLRESRYAVRLFEATTGRMLATLDSPYARPLWWQCFNHDGSRLALAYGTHTIEIWDLKLIRSQLAEMGLDWGH